MIYLLTGLSHLRPHNGKKKEERVRLFKTFFSILDKRDDNLHGKKKRCKFWLVKFHIPREERMPEVHMT